MFVFIIVFKKCFVPAYFPGLWKKKMRYNIEELTKTITSVHSVIKIAAQSNSTYVNVLRKHIAHGKNGKTCLTLVKHFKADEL